MTLNLTQKERMLLADLKSHEEMCIKKYNNYAEQTQDSQLKQIFSSHGLQEQQHLNTINQILNGQVPNVSQQQGQQAQQVNQSQNQQNIQVQNQQKMVGGMNNQDDQTLCNDILTTEKYVSGTYDTAIFEFRDSNIRKALNHIQSEEQKHGEDIFNYMQSNGMYNQQ